MVFGYLNWVVWHVESIRDGYNKLIWAQVQLGLVQWKWAWSFIFLFDVNLCLKYVSIYFSDASLVAAYSSPLSRLCWRCLGVYFVGMCGWQVALWTLRAFR